jgi:hypothetical protein
MSTIHCCVVVEVESVDGLEAVIFERVESSAIMERETAGVKAAEPDVGPELVGPDIVGTEAVGAEAVGAEAVRVEVEIVGVEALGSEPVESGAVGVEVKID